MITFTEFFLFIGLMVAVAYALYWRGEAQKNHFLFKLMLTNKEARDKILADFDNVQKHIEKQMT